MNMGLYNSQTDWLSPRECTPKNNWWMAFMSQVQEGWQPCVLMRASWLLIGLMVLLHFDTVCDSWPLLSSSDMSFQVNQLLHVWCSPMINDLYLPLISWAVFSKLQKWCNITSPLLCQSVSSWSVSYFVCLQW